MSIDLQVRCVTAGDNWMVGKVSENFYERVCVLWHVFFKFSRQNYFIVHILLCPMWMTSCSWSLWGVPETRATTHQRAGGRFLKGRMGPAIWLVKLGSTKKLVQENPGLFESHLRLVQDQAQLLADALSSQVHAVQCPEWVQGDELNKLLLWSVEVTKRNEIMERRQTKSGSVSSLSVFDFKGPLK